MGEAEVCVTATRFNRIPQVWAARFRGLAPTATVMPALRASEPCMTSWRCWGSANPAIYEAPDSIFW